MGGGVEFGGNGLRVLTVQPAKTYLCVCVWVDGLLEEQYKDNKYKLYLILIASPPVSWKRKQ